MDSELLKEAEAWLEINLEGTDEPSGDYLVELLATFASQVRRNTRREVAERLRVALCNDMPFDSKVWQAGEILAELQADEEDV